MAEAEYLQWQGCLRKKVYLTKPAAVRVAKQTPKKAGKRAEAYACRWCQYWHVGHNFAGRSKTSRRMLRVRDDRRTPR